MMLALEWWPGASDATAGGTPQRVPIWRAGLAVLLMGSFLWGTIQWMTPLFKGRSSANYRNIAKKIVEQKLEGPFASDSRVRGVFVAFHSGRKYVGFPPTRDPQLAAQMLHEVGVHFMLVWDSPRGFETRSIAPVIVKTESWKEVLKSHGATIYQYTGAKPTTWPTTGPSTDRPPADVMGEDDDEGAAAPEEAPPRKRRTKGGGR
jgi:hypothetical protein